MRMEIIISGRRMNVTEDVRQMVIDRLEREVAKLADQVQRAEVEFSAGEGKNAPVTTVEITLRSKGPVIRAAGAADDKRLAFEAAVDKLRTQLRRAADRRKTRRGLRGQGLASVAPDLVERPTVPETPAAPEKPATRLVAGIEVSGDGPLVVREKNFSSPKLTLGQALDELELVGHDFFLYVDADTGLPSVVYHRKAYDYGVIHLSITN